MKSKINEIGEYIKEIRESNAQLNEAQTKQYFIVPFFQALGYKTNKLDEFIPEYTADFGTKQGEKVDYAVLINGKPIIIVEAKKLGLQLNNTHVSQLFRYFSTTDAKFAILTNGDDYWIFTDTEKDNVMDMEPYFKIKVSEIDNDKIEGLYNYKRDNIDQVDIRELAQKEKIENTVRELIDELFSGSIPNEFISMILDKANIDSYNKLEVAKFTGSYIDKKLGRKIKGLDKRVKSEEESVECDREYNYLETKDFSHINLEYIKLFGQKLDIKKARNLLVETIELLLQANKVNIEDLGNIKSLALATSSIDMRSPYKLKLHAYYINTSFSYSLIITIIDRLLKAAGASENDLIIKFRERDSVAK